MDQLNLQTKLMRGLASKALEAVIRKKVGYNVVLDISKIQVTVSDDNAHLSLALDADMDISEFEKITRIMNSRE